MSLNPSKIRNFSISRDEKIDNVSVSKTISLPVIDPSSTPERSGLIGINSGASILYKSSEGSWNAIGQSDISYMASVTGSNETVSSGENKDIFSDIITVYTDNGDVSVSPGSIQFNNPGTYSIELGCRLNLTGSPLMLFKSDPLGSPSISVETFGHTAGNGIIMATFRAVAVAVDDSLVCEPTLNVLFGTSAQSLTGVHLLKIQKIA